MPKETKVTRKQATPRTRRKRAVAVTHDQIERRAYELHLEGFGDPLANWLRAERELVTA